MGGDDVRNVRTLLPEPALDPELNKVRIGESRAKNIRFPWTHNRDPDAFQSLKALHWVNHTQVPLWVQGKVFPVFF